MARAATFLLSQYNLRKNRNSRYSQRAFARQLGINSGKLSQYFSGERLISKTACRSIASKIELTEEQRAYFLHLCEVDEREKKSPTLRQLRDDQVSLIVEWYHFAILALVSTNDFRLDYDWIASRLGIPASFVPHSLQCLERIGMIKIEKEKVHLTPGPLITSENIPNEFLTLAHQDVLKHTADNIFQVPIEKRDISSITLAIDEKKLPEAKKVIRTFRRKLANMLSYGKKNQVYTLNIQLFPLTQEVSK